MLQIKAMSSEWNPRHLCPKMFWVGHKIHRVGCGGWDNRCYSYLSQMQNDANRCDMSLYKVLFGMAWVMQGWDESCRGGVEWVGHVGVGWGGSCRGGGTNVLVIILSVILKTCTSSHINLFLWHMIITAVYFSIPIVMC